MDLESFREYCLSMKGVTESYPFGEETLVFKVMGKMFALADVQHFTSVNLKAEPEKAILLQEAFAAVSPGYHMNKKHWITVENDGSVPDKDLRAWIDESYTLVVSGLTKKLRLALSSL